MVPSQGGSSCSQSCHSAAFFLCKTKFRLGLGCREDGFAVLMFFTLACGAWPVFRVQKHAGPNTVGKHQPLQWRRATFYYVFCRSTRHQTENSDVILGSYFLSCSSISICIILLKNKSSSVHVALNSLKLACCYLTEPLIHCCEWRKCSKICYSLSFHHLLEQAKPERKGDHLIRF